MPQSIASSCARENFEEYSWLASGQVPALNGLRALAIAMVLCAHVSGTHGFPSYRPLQAVFSNGGIGVDIFFVISGFLITILLFREFQKEASINLRSFYFRRSIRIFPAYFALLATVFVIQYLGYFTLTARDWTGALTYTINFLYPRPWVVGHAWSLSIEEHFYLVWPLLLSIVRPRFAIWVAAAMIVFPFIFRTTILTLAPSLLKAGVEDWTFARIDGIATGCLLACVASNARGRQWLNSAAKSRTLCCLAIIVPIAFMILHSGKLDFVMALSINPFCIALLVWACVTSSRGPLAAVLNHPIMQVIGIGSYSIYLWQQLFLQPHNSHWLTSFPQNLIFVALAGLLSYFLIERPFLNFKKRLGSSSSASYSKNLQYSCQSTIQEEVSGTKLVPHKII